MHIQPPLIQNTHNLSCLSFFPFENVYQFGVKCLHACILKIDKNTCNGSASFYYVQNLTNSAEIIFTFSKTKNKIELSLKIMEKRGKK